MSWGVLRLMAMRRPSAVMPTMTYCSRSEEHTSELQSQSNLVCRLLLEKKKPEDCSVALAIVGAPLAHRFAHSPARARRYCPLLGPQSHYLSASPLGTGYVVATLCRPVT